jgi:hypothetical protein
MCLHPTAYAAATQPQPATPCAAQRLGPPQRQTLAVAALAGAQPITQLAADYQVSRKFVYQQAALAEHALAETFDPDPPADGPVLFYLPVTERWLRRLIVALLLLCHSSYRGVYELLRDLLHCPRSLGYIHNVARAALARARAHNGRQDLSGVGIGAHDELFQARAPVRVGVDVASTYCYLLSLEEHRDAETWGVRLLVLQAHGFAPQAIIGDAGSGLRAGQELALPDTPRRSDVFHVLHEVTPLVASLESRAYQALETCVQLDRNRPSTHGGTAAATPASAKSSATPGRPRRGPWPWPTTWPRWWAGCAAISWRWRVPITRPAVPSMTSSSPNSGPARRRARTASARPAPTWPTSVTRCWRLPSNWTATWPRWP